VLEIEDAELEPLEMDGLLVPVLRMTRGDPPHIEVRLGGLDYRYDRSYPERGYAAVLPEYLREQMASGKRPLLIERSERLYVYLSQ
jgi:hypothetical protein